MSTRRFFIPHDQIQPHRALLTGSELHHLRHVLRLRPGDRIIVCDETHQEYHGTITRFFSTYAEIAILAPTMTNSSSFSLTLAQGLLKGAKMDLVIEKATELGVSEIVPFFSAFTIAHLPPERQSERLARWQRIAQSATKQSGSPCPAIVQPRSFQDILSAAPAAAGKALLYENESAFTFKTFSRAQPCLSSLWIVIGPEGGFVPHEVAQAREAGFQVVGLGTRLLRAETASIVAVALSQFLWGEHLPPLPVPSGLH
jgi:16S rRNA (uracil1498-N3)-methyltransferase